MNIRIEFLCPPEVDVSPIFDRVESFSKEIPFSASQDRYILQCSDYADAVELSGFCAALCPNSFVNIISPIMQNCWILSRAGWPNATLEEREALRIKWAEGYDAGEKARNDIKNIGYAKPD